MGQVISSDKEQGLGLEDDMSFTLKSSERPVIDPIKHHLELEEGKWQRRELAIYYAETRIWANSLYRCISREGSK